MAFNAKSAADSARRLMSGKRNTRTASRATPTRISTTRLKQGPSSVKDQQERSDRSMTARMKQPSNIGS